MVNEEIIVIGNISDYFVINFFEKLHRMSDEINKNIQFERCNLFDKYSGLYQNRLTDDLTFFNQTKPSIIDDLD